MSEGTKKEAAAPRGATFEQLRKQSAEIQKEVRRELAIWEKAYRSYGEQTKKGK